jgi:hypothetical protein
MARLQIERGIDVREAAATALASLIATGEFAAEEARAAAYSTFSRIGAHEGNVWGSVLGPVAGEMGVVRLVDKAGDMTSADPLAAAELRELRDTFLAEVAAGTFGLEAIKILAPRGFSGQAIELLREVADVAEVFVGSVFADILTGLGGSPNLQDRSPTSVDWRFRDALRDVINQGFADPVGSGWVASLTTALREGRQSAAELTAELSTLLEHGYALAGRSTDRSYVSSEPAALAAREAAFQQLDRLVGEIGANLLADGRTSPALKEIALDWYRAQSPAGILAISNAASALGLFELVPIAQQALNNFDWAAERARVETTISVGDRYQAGSSAWTAFREQEARHDLKAALELAGKAVESRLDVLVDMGTAWGLLSNGTLTGKGGFVSLIQTALKEAARTVLSTDLTTTASGLANEVAAGMATVLQVQADIRAAVALADLPYPDNSNAYTAVNNAFKAALVSFGLKDAAAAGFLGDVQSGEALRPVFSTGGDPAKTQAAIQNLMQQAAANGISVDYVLTEILGDSRLGTTSQHYIAGLLDQRADSGAMGREILRELGDKQLTVAQAIDILKDTAAATNGSYANLLADLIDLGTKTNSAQTGNFVTIAYNMGGRQLADMLGADFAAGRIDAADAAAAVYVIAGATQGPNFRPSSLAAFVDAAGRNAATAAAEAVKLLDDALAAGVQPFTVAAALDSILGTLSKHGLSLDTADTAALSTLADLYVRGVVRNSDIVGLIGAFDGKVPDAALVTMMDKIDSLADSPLQDEIKLVVAEILDERIDSGAFFTDLAASMESIYRSQLSVTDKAAAYQKLLDFAEKANQAASYADFYEKAHEAIADPRAAATAAEKAVELAAPMLEMTSAYKLYLAADAVGYGTGFTQWVVNTAGHVNRDLVLQGLMLDMTAHSQADGTMAPEDQQHFDELRRELMQPELKAAEALRRAAMNLSPAEQQLAAERGAADVARAVGIAGMGLATALDAAGAPPPSASDEVASLAHYSSMALVGGVMLARSAASGAALATQFGYSAAAGAGAFVAVSLAVTGLSIALQFQSFRDAIGEDTARVLDFGVAVLGLVKVAPTAAVEGLITQKSDAAVNMTNNFRDVFNNLDNPDAAGRAFARAMDNMSALINPTDPRPVAALLTAGFEAAAKALITFRGLIGGDAMHESDMAYTRNHTLGISFL